MTAAALDPATADAGRMACAYGEQLVRSHGVDAGIGGLLAAFVSLSLRYYGDPLSIGADPGAGDGDR